VPARVPAVESYACIGCGEPVEEGRARLAAVTCHECDGRVEPEHDSGGLDGAVADSFSTGAVDDELRRELYRSRRYERPLAVAAVRLAALNGYRAVARQELEQRLRAVDRVWEAGDHIVVMLPETDRHGAEHLLARLTAEVPGLLPEPHVGLAAFPSDALTAAELLTAAKESVPATNGNGAVHHEHEPSAEDHETPMLRRLMPRNGRARRASDGYSQVLH
jgi:hypothetical protein